jgi:hypothetical protein
MVGYDDGAYGDDGVDALWSLDAPETENRYRNEELAVPEEEGDLENLGIGHD